MQDQSTITRPADLPPAQRFRTIGPHLIDELTPAYAPTKPPEAAHAASEFHEDDKPVIYSRMSPLVNVVLIVIGFAVCSVALILRANKPLIVVALCVGLPLLLVAAWAVLSRWRG